VSATTASASVELPRRRLRFTPRALVLAVIMIALLFYLVVPMRTYVAQRNRLSQLERQTQILEQQNQVLSQQVARLNDPAYVEQIARECLGMIRPGEISFVIVPKEGAPQPPSCSP
jgi:cell division protein FtsL